MNPLAVRLEDPCHRILGEPVDLEVRTELAQLACDRDVALRVAEPNGRRDVQRAFPPAARASPSPGRRLRRSEKLAEKEVHLHRVASVWGMAGSVERDERAV